MISCADPPPSTGSRPLNYCRVPSSSLLRIAVSISCVLLAQSTGEAFPSVIDHCNSADSVARFHLEFETRRHFFSIFCLWYRSEYLLLLNQRFLFFGEFFRQFLMLWVYTFFILLYYPIVYIPVRVYTNENSNIRVFSITMALSRFVWRETLEFISMYCTNLNYYVVIMD